MLCYPYGSLATKLLLGTLGLGAPACQQDEKVIDDEASRHKYAEAEDTQSLNIEEVNDYVSTSNIVFLK